MRLVLAAIALLIIWLDPSEPDRFVPITYGALILYTLYSAAVYLLVLRSNSLWKRLKSYEHWIDVGWYLVLIALSSGTNSIFFFFFFFSILVASFQSGYKTGLRVTFISSLLFTVIGYVSSPEGVDFPLNRFLLRPIYLVVLGYMMAYWGGYEIRLKRKLALLKEVNILSNPRFGVDRTIGTVMERLRHFYGADRCLLIMMDDETSEYKMRRTTSSNPEGGVNTTQVDANLVERLLNLPATIAFVYNGQRPFFSPFKKSFQAFDVERGERNHSLSDRAERIATLLEAKNLVSVPLKYRDKMLGRIFITSTREPFVGSDADLLLQVFEQVFPVLENIHLVDKLASEAAEQERQRIARNIHDSVIQPYLGLQYGLSTVYRQLESVKQRENDEKVNATIAEISKRIELLVDMTNAGISDLRQYINGLKNVSGRDNCIITSVHRYAEKFSAATGIAVKITTEGNLSVSDRVAAEVFQILTEGLSNIRRHTRADQALVQLYTHNGSLTLNIQDNGVNDVAEPFFPRSISQRAASLGGIVNVERHTTGTVVSVELPL